jgi:propanol-preferring alcohol dehydrogenase
VPIGDLDPIEAAPLTDAGLTTYTAIKSSLPVVYPGSTAVVIGIGGLGLYAIHFFDN